MPDTRDILFLTWTLTGNKEWRAEHPYRDGWYFVLTCTLDHHKTWCVKRYQSGPGDFMDLVDDSPSFHHAAVQASILLITQAAHEDHIERSQPALGFLKRITEARFGLPRAVEAIERSCTGESEEPMVELYGFLSSVPLSVEELHTRRAESIERSMRTPTEISA